MLVVGAEGFGGPVAEADDQRPSRQKQQAQASGGTERAGKRAPIRIMSEEEFCRLAGVPTPDTLKRQYHAHARPRSRATARCAKTTCAIW